MQSVVIAAASMFATAAFVSPPPPPPEYVTHAADILTGDWTAAETPAFAALFSDDVVANVDARETIKGKKAWLAFERAAVSKYNRRVEGYVRSSLPSPGDYGDLLIIDEVNPVHTVSDPLWSTRSSLYRFGRDHLIHTVLITRVYGFLEPAPRKGGAYSSR